MRQAEIMVLLEEAVSASERRRHEIANTLVAAASYDPDVQMITSHMFWQTLTSRADLLPALFPAFALICSRETYRDHVSGPPQVDWSLIPIDPNEPIHAPALERENKRLREENERLKREIGSVTYRAWSEQFRETAWQGQPDPIADLRRQREIDGFRARWLEGYSPDIPPFLPERAMMEAVAET
jgi:hypothetical protein